MPPARMNALIVNEVQITGNDLAGAVGLKVSATKNHNTS
jgi:hypothetical protein